MTHPYEDTPIRRIVDGGYLSWSYGSIGWKSWRPMKQHYTLRSGTLVCLDSHQSLRRDFYSDYKSHRAKKREKRHEIHEKVIMFQEYLREDPMIRKVEFSGLEADDWIALMTPRYHLPVTAIDKDLLQIPNVVLTRLDDTDVLIDQFAHRLPKTIQTVIQSPEDILLTLVLMGDKSDDIPRLIPPRNLDLFLKIKQADDSWKVAYRLYGEALLRNLYLAVLPGPWCFNPVPSPKKVLSLVRSGSWPPNISCHITIIEILKNLEEQCLLIK